MPHTKICSRCKQEKSREDFYKKTDRPGERQSWCKRCWLDRQHSQAMTALADSAKCSSCQIVKPAAEFNRNRGARNGLQAYCKTCIKAKQYGTPVTWYAETLEAQGGVCGICGNPPMGSRFLVVDHDHNCCPGKVGGCGGCVRGLLCNACNVRLYALENKAWYLAAEAYLKRHA